MRRAEAGVKSATSLFLDALRLGAAATVFLAHSTNYWWPAAALPLQSVAHRAVIVFFVLSGYVIARSADGKTDGRAFAAARLSRLYSVVLPALLLTGAFWWLGSRLDPQFYERYARKAGALRYLLTFLHLNEVWTLEASPPGNEAFWSLGYEAWYYLLFGIYWFVKDRKRRWTLLAAGGLIVGPKVLLLLPAWLAGVAAYFWRERVVTEGVMAKAGFFAVFILVATVVAGMPDWPFGVGTNALGYSGAAISDLVGAIFWAGLVWSFDRAFGDSKVSEPLKRGVRAVADHTFSLYLFHVPVVLFTTALIPPLGMGPVGGTTVIVSMLLVIAFLGHWVESHRYRWRLGFDWLLARLLDLRRPNGPAA